MHRFSTLPLAALSLAALGFAAPAHAGPGDAKLSRATADGTRSADAEPQDAFLFGQKDFKARKLRVHQGKRTTQFELEVGAPSLDELPRGAAELKVESKSKDGDRFTESVTLNFADIEVHYLEVLEPPAEGATFEITAVRTDGRKRKLSAESCTLELRPGARCSMESGDTVEVHGRANGDVVLDYAHLYHADSKLDPADQNVMLRKRPGRTKVKSASPKLAPAKATATVWTATGTANRAHHRELDHVGAYNFMVEISGVNAGYFKAAGEMTAQYGEILIDGIEFEFE